MGLAIKSTADQINLFSIMRRLYLRTRR